LPKAADGIVGRDLALMPAIIMVNADIFIK